MKCLLQKLKDTNYFSIFLFFVPFLFGTLYLVPLVALVLIGIYLLFAKHYPDFLSSKIVGIILVIIGLLMVFHISYIKDGVTWQKIIQPKPRSSTA